MTFPNSPAHPRAPQPVIPAKAGIHGPARPSEMHYSVVLTLGTDNVSIESLDGNVYAFRIAHAT